MFIAISEYLKPISVMDEKRPQHQAFLKVHFANDKLLTCGRLNSQDGGVIITKNITRSEFENILSHDPYVIAGYCRYDITEFTPTINHESFNL
ncbi:YciI family protein [Francisella sp. Scap27]|uniref:YciI family protein n=1 Tax=Francisella sp. Scap27 TaxID=2589986 RepID=UPI0015B92B78|nr:YciI family protein [Francisella sp. Scap27]